MGKLGTLGRNLGVIAAAVTLSGAPAEAQETNAPVVLASSEGVSTQVTDCVGFVKEQRALAAETGIAMSRSEQKGLLLDCRNGDLEVRIAEQKRILAALDAEIQQIGLRIDENARIIDEQGRELAQIVAINGRLVIRIQETDARIAETDAEIRELQADTAAKLEEAERILQRLATS